MGEVYMKLSEKITIVELIAKAEDKGCSCIMLSQEVSAVSSEIRKFLNDHPAFFCKVGDSAKYMLNTSSEYNADVNRIITTLQRSNRGIDGMRNEITFLNFY